MLKNIEEEHTWDEKVIKEIPHYYVDYDDDLLKSEKHQVTMDKIFEYLGLPSCQVNTRFVRLTSDKISDFVENYQDMKESLANTKYARFLN
jgi:hypothetical protein